MLLSQVDTPLYLFVLYIEKKHILLSWLIGINLYILILFEPTPLITGIIFLGILLHAFYEKRLSLKAVWKLITNLVLAFLSLHIIFSLFFSFNLFQAFMYVLEDAVHFNEVAQRPYWIWVGENAKEFFYVAGVPIVTIMVYMTVNIFTQWNKSRNITHWSAENVFVIALMLTFLIIVFLGVNRGEITRLWIFLAVFFQVPAAIFMAKNVKGDFPFFLVSCTLIFQTILTLCQLNFV